MNKDEALRHQLDYVLHHLPPDGLLRVLVYVYWRKIRYELLKLYLTGLKRIGLR